MDGRLAVRQISAFEISADTYTFRVEHESVIKDCFVIA